MKIKRFCDIIKENDNLNKSYKTMSKFGLGYDPNKEFRPNWFIKTRYEIAEELLNSYYKSKGDEFEDLDEDIQEKMLNDFNQLLSDEDCQIYVENIANAFIENIDEELINDIEMFISRTIIKNKKFDIEKYEN